MLNSGFLRGSPWPTPNAIPNLALWLDADHDGSFAVDSVSGAITSWTSRDASARAFTPVDVTQSYYQPIRTRKANWNNRKVVCSQLSAATGLKSASYDIASNFAANGTDITVFMAVHTDDVSSQFGTVYYHYITGAQGHYFRLNNTPGVVSNICLSTFPIINGSNANYVGGPKIIGLQRNGTAHTSWIDGQQELSVTATPTAISAGSNAIMYIGTQTGSGGSGIVGDIAEIIMYARALSTAERQKIENYLAAKWYGIN